MEKWYEERVEQILNDVEHILLGDAAMSHGARIVIEVKLNEPMYLSYSIKEKVVK